MNKTAIIQCHGHNIKDNVIRFYQVILIQNNDIENYLFCETYSDTFHNVRALLKDNNFRVTVLFNVSANIKGYATKPYYEMSDNVKKLVADKIDPSEWNNYITQAPKSAYDY